MTLPILPMQDMHRRHPGLTEALATSFIEAASVVLSSHHKPPQVFSVESDQRLQDAYVQWGVPSQRCLDAYNNSDDAKRDGAYACALAAVEMTRGMVAVRRAERLTGADYYIGPVSETLPNDLESCLRLEVSGTDQDPTDARYILREKMLQARDGRSALPALAAVVGFRIRQILIKTVEESDDVGAVAH